MSSVGLCSGSLLSSAEVPYWPLMGPVMGSSDRALCCDHLIRLSRLWPLLESGLYGVPFDLFTDPWSDDGRHCRVKGPAVQATRTPGPAYC